MIKLCKIIILLLPLKVYASPEMGIKTLLGMLDELKTRLENVNAINEKNTIQEQKIESENIYENAKKLYTQGEFYAVIQHLNIYLNSVQSPHLSHYLSAQYFLARSYEELGYKKRAARAYHRYLASFVTADRVYDKLIISVIQNLLLLTDDFYSKDYLNIKTTISSLASIDFPSKVKSRILFYLALTSNQSRYDYFADKLFDESYQSTLEPSLKIENIYYSALIPLRRKKYDKAEYRFNKLLSIQTKDYFDYDNFARLNLARIAAVQNKKHTAISYLSLIAENSKAYGDALYESISLYYETEQFEEGLIKAKYFLDKYPKHRDASEVIRLKALLEIQTGRSKDAEKTLEKSYSKLKQFHEWLQRSYSDVDQLDHDDIKRIVSKGRFLNETPHILKKSLKYFESMSRLQLYLDNIRSKIRTEVYFLGSLQPSRYNPNWSHLTKSYELLARDAFDLSDHILNIERNYFSSKLDNNTLKKLHRSKLRRDKLRKKFGQENSKVMRWQSWLLLNQYLQKFNKVNEKSHKIQSSLASLRFNYKNHSNHDLFEQLLSRTHFLQKNLNRGVEIVRSRLFKDLANQGHHMRVKQYLLLYSQAIYEESTILSKQRDHYDQPNERQMIEDLQNSWQKWEYLIKHIHHSIVLLDKEIRDTIESKLQDLDVSIAKYESIKAELARTDEFLKTTLGNNAFVIMNHYFNIINERLSEIAKWQADNQWKKYSDISLGRRKVEENVNGKIIDMEENLRDLEYEVPQ